MELPQNVVRHDRHHLPGAPLLCDNDRRQAPAHQPRLRPMAPRHERPARLGRDLRHLHPQRRDQLYEEGFLLQQPRDQQHLPEPPRGRVKKVKRV
eukprot:3807845-Heterocapsa_arctica.AAC.1